MEFKVLIIHLKSTNFEYFSPSLHREVWNGVKAKIGIVSDDRNSNQEWSSIHKICRQKTDVTEVYKRFAAIPTSSTGNTQRHCLTRALVIRLGLLLSITLNRMENITCAWIKPAEDMVKAVEHTTDGSITSDSGGFGEAARNHYGEVLFAFSGNNCSTSILAQELLDIKMGQVGCLQMGFKRVAVALDT
ncbi:hypothetical protein IFM89_028404 [Coptis chinensis]|uniref:RNase H type-1 domain-containing protein n=1 Tax=Coptis chinensis TaxID=261450 RepID=A0A835H891_9MAGN|nr:hypothetical protein IFM89_028404 [Coptis chinensis]